MHVTATGQSEYKGGHEVLRYARDIENREMCVVWYHDGLRCIDEPAWAMETDVHWKMSVSVDTILVANADGLYAINADQFGTDTITIDDKEQVLATASHDYVRHVGDPSDHLGMGLWVCSGDQVHENYHQEAGH